MFLLASDWLFLLVSGWLFQADSNSVAGTGIYVFWLADKGHDVTATDITPRHIDIINRTLTNKNYHMNTSDLNATDMSCFADDSFDIVLNMGPFYHLWC